MHIALVTDAWHPQINGVVMTYVDTIAELERQGHEVTVLSPMDFPSFPLPFYKEIELCLTPWAVAKKLHKIPFDALHIATEGPMGWAARNYAMKRYIPFTTAVHTQFAPMLKAMIGVPESWTKPFMRNFHLPAVRTFVPTPAMAEQLRADGYDDLVIWGRGIDGQRFQPTDAAPEMADLAKPIMLNIGRVSAEKNLKAFLDMPAKGSKVIVGDGPQFNALKKQYPNVVWLGKRAHDDLAPYYSAADVFVFPSKADTFGRVMLESMACGTPVAAYPVTGPIDVVTSTKAGSLHDDLAVATVQALTCKRDDCVAFAQQHTLQAVTKTFVQSLAPLDATATLRAQ